MSLPSARSKYTLEVENLGNLFSSARHLSLRSEFLWRVPKRKAFFYVAGKTVNHLDEQQINECPMMGFYIILKKEIHQININRQGHLPPDQVAPSPSNLTLDTSRHGAVTASLGNLCQGLTTLTVTCTRFTPQSQAQPAVLPWSGNNPSGHKPEFEVKHMVYIGFKNRHTPQICQGQNGITLTPGP
ncbi:hypothetical protein BTVI_48957 [Pitangus sulphuratus]|nr:hypothetical protein BTVI_48957 [Pitangus sulphuratus]